MIRHVIISAVLMLWAAAPARAAFIGVPIEGVIDGGLAAFIDRTIAEAEDGGADGIIFRLDTPGGRIDSAVHIKDAILNAGVPTTAFVDKSAISAGALIALACDNIYMATGASIGAATAVDLEGNKASEKVISYFRAQMRATAQANGRRADLAEAMVDEQLVIEDVVPVGQLLTLTYSEALDLGIADGIEESAADVAALVGEDGATIVWARENWAERVVRFLTNPIVSSLLMSLGFLGLLVEIKTPGWGVGGTIALVALALFFGSHYIVRLAGFGELIMFSAGIILLALEIFVIPGFGVAGISGIGLILVSLYLSLVGRMPVEADFTRAMYTLGGAFIVAFAGGAALIKLFPSTPLYRKLTLAKSSAVSDGYISAATDTGLVGMGGVALTDLHPAGKADFDGRRLDVVTEGGFIDRGGRVIVVETRGARIVVRDAGPDA